MSSKVVSSRSGIGEPEISMPDDSRRVRNLCVIGLKLFFVLFLGVAFYSQLPATAHAQSGTINWSGWSFDYTIGDSYDGVAINNVTFQGKQIMGKGNFPAMPVYYDNNRCGPYLDRLDDDLEPVSWANNATVVSREFTINGEQWYELGIRNFIGQYDIYQVWYFNGNGIIDAHLFSRGIQCNVYHEHWPHWRFDFDIAGSGNDQILRQTASGLQPYTTEFNVNANAADNHEWYVQDTITGDAVQISFDSGAWNVTGTVVPETNYAKNRVIGRRYQSGQEDWHASGHSSLPANWNDGVNQVGYGNGENIDNQDIVLWYSGYLPHSASEGPTLWHSTGVRITVNGGNGNGRPVISNPGDQAHQIGDVVNLPIDASDADDDPLTYSASGLPAGLSINSSTGVIAGTLLNSSVGTYSTVVTVDDGTASSAASFTWIVTDPNATTILYDFESPQGWTTNPSGTDTATTGRWERADPQGTESSGTTLQLGTTVSGQYALVTGGTAGASAGTNDIDNGNTTARSPDITIPAGGQASLSFSYYFAHLNNATNADYLRVSVVGATTVQIFEELGDPNSDAASWAEFSTSLNSFAGQTIYLLIDAADAATGSLIEAAIDDVLISITAPPNELPAIVNPGNQTNTVGDSVNLTIDASDADGDALTFGASNLPTGLSINANSGTIAGTLNSVGTFNVTITVNDGNGGSDGDSFTWIVNEIPNNAPTASAGPDQTLTDSDNSGVETVTLDGSGSSDGDGSITIYTWSGIPGVTIPGVANPTVDVPVGSYNVTLTVTDDDGATATDTVSITVNEPANNAPTADAGPDQTLTDSDSNGVETVTLDGSGSSDGDGSITIYTWSGIPGVTIPGVANPTVDVPVGSYNVTLTVTDDDGATATDTVSITVNEPANNAPTASAGPDQTLTDSDNSGVETVTLDGSGSSDSDGSLVGYTWSGIPGITIPGVANPTVDVPVGSYNVSLTVTDDDGATATDTVSITVNAGSPVGCGPLQQEAEDGILSGRFTIAADAAASGGSYVHTPEGSGSSNFSFADTAEYCMSVSEAGDYRIKAQVFSADGTSNSFFVTVNDQPAVGYLFDMQSTNSYVPDLVSDRDGADPVIVSLLAGDAKITFHLREDGTRLDTVALEPFSSSNNPPAVADIGSQVNFVGDAVSLQVSASDPNNDALTYTAAGLPDGLTINASSGLISGSPTAAGNFNTTIIVSDGSDSATTTFNWTVNSGGTACGPLDQEAEDATLFGDFAIGTDVNASGGSYIHVPEGTGNAGPGSSSKAVFCFDVPTDGTYQLRGDIYAADGTSDSFFASIGNVNGEFLWTISRNTAYNSDLLNDRTMGLDPVTFALEAGQTSVVISLREDGARLDRLALEVAGSGPVNNPPTVSNLGGQVGLVGNTVSLQIDANDIDGDPLTFSATGLPDGLSINSASGLITGAYSAAGTFNSTITVSDGADSASTNVTWTVTSGGAACGPLDQEAEDATLLGDFVTAADGTASGGFYIHVPEGTGNSNINTSSQAVYCFDVPAAGDYQIAVSALALDGTSNSLFMRVNGAPTAGYLFDLDVTTDYVSDLVSNRSGADPVIVTLPAGEAQVIFYLREDGARLDTVSLQPAGTVGAQSLNRALANATLQARGILGSLTEMSTTPSADEEAGVANVTITLMDEATRGDLHQESVTTDAKGRFFFDTMPIGQYVLSVNTNGQPLEEPVIATDETMSEVNFRLESEELNGQSNPESTSSDLQKSIFIPLLGF